MKPVVILYPLILLLCVSVQCKTVERDVEALQLFKREVVLRDTYWEGVVESWSGGGPNGEDDPCANGWKSDWEGIECRFQGDLDPDVPRVVTNIHVTDSNATGPIPLAITLLKDLVEIDMDGNKMTGPLNPYLGCLPNLKELDLANNSLTGAIPAEWKFLTKCVAPVLDVGYRGWCRLEEAELELNPGLRGCIPQGMPPEEKVCPEGPRRINEPECFLIGTIVFDTAIDGFCPEDPLIDKRCPDVAFVEQFIEEGTPYDLYYRSQVNFRTEGVVTQEPPVLALSEE